MKEREAKMTTVQGRRFYKSGEAHYKDLESQINAALENIEWKTVKELGKIGYSQAAGINAIIKDFELNVEKIALISSLAPFSFYGLRCRYKGGTIEHFFLDTGVEAIPLFSQAEESFFTFHEKLSNEQGR